MVEIVDSARILGHNIREVNDETDQVVSEINGIHLY